MNSVNRTYYSFADLVLAIEGDGAAAEAMRTYWRLYSMEERHPEEASITIAIHESIEKLNIQAQYYSLSKIIAFNSKEFRVSRGGLLYKVSNLFTENTPVRIDIYFPIKESKRSNFASFVRTYGVRPIKYVDRYIESISNYSCLLWILAVALLKYGRIFVHSGMISYGRENGIIFCGTGGCGKTSAMFELLNGECAKYMAEDFGVLSMDGTMYSIPKRPTIYASDVKHGNEIILRAMEKLPASKKIIWKFAVACGLNPRYRFPLEDLFLEDKWERKAAISNVFLLSRCSEKDVHIFEIDKDELVNRIMMASFREINSVYEILCNIHAAGGEEVRPFYPTLEELKNQYKKILRAAIENAECRLLRVFVECGPKEIVKAIDVNSVRLLNNKF